MKKKIIYGCDSRGDGESPYLTRWTLIDTKLGAVYLHRFHRSDADEHHDHPWAFVSIILWRGYWEETPCKECDGVGWWISYPGAPLCSLPEQVMCEECQGEGSFHRRKLPGMILFRKATHRHRVQLVQGLGRLSGHPCDVFTYPREAWSLVVRGPYVREWGFFTKAGWQRWKEYFTERGC